MYILIGIAIVLTVLTGIYFYYFLHRILTSWYKGELRRWMKALLILCSVILAASCLNPFGIAALVVYHIFGISVVLDIISRIPHLSKNHKWNVMWRSGLVPIALTAVILLYGHAHMLHIQEKTYEVTTEKHLSSPEGYRAVFLSDLHFGTTMQAEKLQKICDEITAQNPDFVLLGGDIVDEQTTREEMEQSLQILGDIQTRYGVFYVYGNHDSASYSDTPNYTLDDLDTNLAKNDIICISDKTYEINDDLLLVGRNDRGYGGASTRSDTSQLLAGQDLRRFVLLMDHQPVELNQNAEAGVDLQLSGHTHGGQIWPVGLISDLLGFGEMNYGEKQIGDCKIIVSSGIAGWGYAVRTGHDSEYLMVHIKEA